MAEIKLGNKIQCRECEAKYYDLGKPAPVCPKCGTAQSAAEEPAKAPPVRRPPPKKSSRPKVDEDAADPVPAAGAVDGDPEGGGEEEE